MIAKNTICLWFDERPRTPASTPPKTFPTPPVEARASRARRPLTGSEGDVLTVEFTVLGILHRAARRDRSSRTSRRSRSRSRPTTRTRPTATGTRSSATVAGERLRLVRIRWGVSWQITPAS